MKGLILLCSIFFVDCLQEKYSNLVLHPTLVLKSKNVAKPCQLRPLRGLCTKKYIRFYYDGSRNRCLKFHYSGCGGNGEIFRSRGECRRQCIKVPVQRHITSASPPASRPDKRSECDICSRYASCINGNCMCNRGFQGDGVSCTDINECMLLEPNRCDKNAYCINTLGSYRCECQVGYAGSGTLCSNSTEVCDQPFDLKYADHCTGTWEIRHYYNNTSNSCQRFWYGGCASSGNQNFFNDAQTCEQLCIKRDRFQQGNKKMLFVISSKPLFVDPVCMDPFDATLKLDCGGTKEMRYLYNNTIKQCVPFAFDLSCGYTSVSRNIFTFYKTCKGLCLAASRELPEMTEKNEKASPTYADAERSPKIYGEISVQKMNKKKENEKDRCTVPFDDYYQHDCRGSNTWEKRFYYDVSGNECRLFWYGGCKSPANKNIFATLESCEKRCGKAKMKSLSGTLRLSENNNVPLETLDERCLESFDVVLKQQCYGKKEARSYYNVTSRQCEFFSFDSTCKHVPRSRNLFSFYECETLCNSASMASVPIATSTEEPETRLTTALDSFTTLAQNTLPVQTQTVSSSAKECLEPFDEALAGLCGAGEWKARYYYDTKEKSCRLFWWDECQSSSKNFFTELFDCQARCEQLIARPCLEPFDDGYKGNCRGNKYELRWYFNQKKKRCDVVYYGGCKSSSRNIFHSEYLCRDLCEAYAATAPLLATKAPKKSVTNVEDGERRQAMVSPLLQSRTTQVVGDKQYPVNLYARNMELAKTIICDEDKIRGTFDVPRPNYIVHVKATSFEIAADCLEPFEQWLTCSCRQGKWERRYYYSTQRNKCRIYWFDGCESSSKNNFRDLSLCQNMCEGILPGFTTRNYIEAENSRNITQPHVTKRHQLRRKATRSITTTTLMPFGNASVDVKKPVHRNTDWNVNSTEVEDETAVSVLINDQYGSSKQDYSGSDDAISKVLSDSGNTESVGEKTTVSSLFYNQSAGSDRDEDVVAAVTVSGKS